VTVPGTLAVTATAGKDAGDVAGFVVLTPPPTARSPPWHIGRAVP
jgi:hypothetical protein